MNFLFSLLLLTSDPACSDSPCEEVEVPFPVFIPDENWQTNYKFQKQIHPYVGQSIVCFMLGPTAIIVGSAVQASRYSRAKLNDPEETFLLDQNRVKANTTSAILLSSGIVLTTTGIILASIKQESKIQVISEGLVIRF